MKHTKKLARRKAQKRLALTRRMQEAERLATLHPSWTWSLCYEIARKKSDRGLLTLLQHTLKETLADPIYKMALSEKEEAYQLYWENKTSAQKS